MDIIQVPVSPGEVLDKITILEIINSTDTPLTRIASCPLKIGSHTHLCGLHKRLDHAAGLLVEYFDGTTIADVLNEDDEVKPLCESSSAIGISISKNQT